MVAYVQKSTPNEAIKGLSVACNILSMEFLTGEVQSATGAKPAIASMTHAHI